MEWSNEMTVKVIEEYERNPTLWDMSSPDHKDREKKSSAWKKLAECMGAEVSEVQRKIHNLRNQWTAEHRKLNAQRSDSGMAGPKTKWPYYDVLSFIRLSLEARRRKSNLAQAALLHLRSKKTEWFKGRRLLQGRGSIRDQAKESGSSTEELAGTSGGRGVKKTSQLEDESPVDQKVIENVVEGSSNW
ncbi:uncharacterized protein LOC121857781 [Homarus americanus]|uniref:uncharacterized protein LOC121857781 n=1 Tax=Homarus americanus TaxID=6706 RepID=UPI001C48ECEC|nr:uncharacterized protein LOC121857781 [Homarus americanus]XP_042209904.1 uncharacterized protein LOC121857781 [Homarus americanus]XP_042209906.1 uncharacterized protein LOC121857781 [Homarus americanus]